MELFVNNKNRSGGGLDKERPCYSSMSMTACGQGPHACHSQRGIFCFTGVFFFFSKGFAAARGVFAITGYINQGLSVS